MPMPACVDRAMQTVWLSDQIRTSTHENNNGNYQFTIERVFRAPSTQYCDYRDGFSGLCSLIAVMIRKYIQIDICVHMMYKLFYFVISWKTVVFDMLRYGYAMNVCLCICPVCHLNRVFVSELFRRPLVPMCVYVWMSSKAKLYSMKGSHFQRAVGDMFAHESKIFLGRFLLMATPL